MLSIIIVNFYSEDLLSECIARVQRYASDDDYEIIVVSNGSNTDKKQQISNGFPTVKWIESGYNAGFARANNEGIRHSSGGAVLLLNPDVFVDDNCISHAYQRLTASEYIGCGIQLLNEDGTSQISGSHFMTGALNHLLPLPVLGKLFRTVALSAGMKKTSEFKIEDTKEVDWINGAFLMVRRSAIEKAGLLDEDFFLYAEEIEWCSRLGRVGKFVVYGDLHATHLQGEVANTSFGSGGKGYYNLFDKKGKQLLISNFVRVRKQFGAGWFLIHLLVYLLEIPFSFVLALVSNSFTLKQFSGYCRNIGTLLTLSGTIIRNKPHFYKVV